MTDALSVAIVSFLVPLSFLGLFESNTLWLTLAQNLSTVPWPWLLLKLFGLNISLMSLVFLSHCPMLWCDNLGASIVSNPVFHSRTKHPELDLHFLCDKVAMSLLDIRYVPTLEQPPDIFTKPLSNSRFSFLHSKLKVVLFQGMVGCVK